MARYARLFLLQVKASLLLAAQYRWDFLLDAGLSLFWTSTAIIPLFVVYGGGAGIPRWGFSEALCVTAMFVLLQGILEGAISPGLQAVVEHIRKGTLDFVLLKPADAQFLVSTARFHVWRVVNVAVAFTLLIVAFVRLGRWPTLGQVGLALAALACSVAILYSLWILIVSAAFYVVKVDNLTYLLSSIFDAARWPKAVFRGAWAWLFTFVLPLAVMTSHPAEALLGRLEASSLAASTATALAFTLLSRMAWRTAIRNYTSASS